MGNVQLGINRDLALRLRDVLGIQTFIETGTYKGATAVWAAEHFARVITIEGYRKRFDGATRQYAGQFPNIHFFYGDSRHVLSRVLGEVDEPALFWLDAHWCGEGATDAHDIGDECPLVEELTAINNHAFAAQHAILIDDARLFIQPPPYPHDPKQWPSLAEVEKQLSAFPRTTAVYEDIILSVPPKGIGVVSEFMLS